MGASGRGALVPLNSCQSLGQAGSPKSQHAAKPQAPAGNHPTRALYFGNLQLPEMRTSSQIKKLLKNQEIEQVIKICEVYVS